MPALKPKVSLVLLVTRTGAGRPLLLVHGLGSTSRAWNPVITALAAERAVIALDLPGHGGARPEGDSDSFFGLARSLEAYLDAEGLTGVDMVGSSLGGQLVLEMARRGKAGATVALDPGGFWRGWERAALRSSLAASSWTVCGIKPALAFLAGSTVSRSAMLGLLSARPWSVDPRLVASELTAFADISTLDGLIYDLAFGPSQAGPAAQGAGPITVGWGRHDRFCNPAQAARAIAAFPGARLHWFENSGHFPMWDEPAEAAALILRATGTASIN
jgi:pimeloyl-ACP methyl ester carboxylesterase